MTPTKETYLGDGVYASFDGYQIWLRVKAWSDNDDNRDVHRNHRIALEPTTFLALLDYEKSLRAEIAKSLGV